MQPLTVFVLNALCLQLAKKTFASGSRIARHENMGDVVGHPWGALQGQAATIYVYNPEMPHLGASKLMVLSKRDGLPLIEDAALGNRYRNEALRNELAVLLKRQLEGGNKLLQAQVGKEILVVRTANSGFEHFRFFIWSPELCLNRGEIEGFSNRESGFLQCEPLKNPEKAQYKLKKGLVEGVAFGLELELTARDSAEIEKVTALRQTSLAIF